MRVICVTPIITSDAGFENHPRPEVGDNDIVTHVRPHPSGDSDVYYSLERFGDRVGFKADHFATLPDATADEMAEVEFEGIVNLEPSVA